MASRSIPTNGPAIRRARQLAGMDAVQLADAVKISPSWLSRIECGARQASPGLLGRIAKATGRKPEDFVGAELLDAA